MFAGESRRLLVDGLEELFDEVVSSRNSRWVVLSAPSGWGKTRVARELYARLSARQLEPRYWPAEIDPEDSNRKATFPAKVSRDPGALPKFFWWGISCSSREGIPSDSLRRDLAQWETHGAYLELAWKRLTSRRQRVRRGAVSSARTVVEEGISEAVAAAVTQITAAVVPGLGLAEKIVRWGVRKSVEGRREHQMVAGGSELHVEAPPDIIDDVVDVVGRLARDSLPVVILVEDAHSADSALLELLDKTLRRDGALFVITTILPDGHNQLLEELMQRHQQRLVDVDYRIGNPQGFPPGSGLGELERDARDAILHERLGNIETATKEALLDRYTNPLALRLFCEIPAYRKDPKKSEISHEYYDAGGMLVLPERELARLPEGISDLYEQLWKDLPSEMKLALAVAHVITPTNIHEALAGDEDRWNDDFLREVVAAVGLADSDTILTELDQAPNAHAWVRIIDGYLRAFSEHDHKTIVKRHHENMLSDHIPNARNKILTALASMALDPHKKTPAWMNTARTILTLHTEGYITDTALAAEAICGLLRELADSPLDLAERVCLYEHYNEDLDHAEVSAEIDRTIRCFGATAFGEQGQINKAIACFQDLLADQDFSFGSDHPDTLITRHSLAYWLGESGRVSEAIVLSGDLLDDCRRMLGYDHPETLRARYNLARWLGESGRVSEAIVLSGDLLDDCRRVLGYDHPETLVIRNNRASWLGRSGRPDEAVASFQEVLADRERVLGPDHPKTLRTRHNLSFWIGESGRPDEAVASFQEVLADRERVLGSDHPDTLVTANNLAFWLGESGRLDEAVALSQEVLADRERVLGPGDRGTLRTRYNLARWLGESGKPDEAVALFQELIEDRERVLGPNHRDTLATRRHLDALLSDRGHGNA